MNKLLLLIVAATVPNVALVWILTHFFIIMLGAAGWGNWSFTQGRRRD